MLIIGNNLVLEHLSVPICVAVTIIVFGYVLYENNRTLPNLGASQSVFRAFELMIISYSLSLVIGMLAIDVVGFSIPINAKNDSIEEPLCYTWLFLKDCDGLTLRIFPEYLIRFSFLAMFIGVFIQMIFEEKNITEM
jgi:hypothetical protein